jgi:CheY-like chemotaxis protein
MNGKGNVAPLRVLVVDDNDDAATSMALMLRLHGHEAATATDGAGALASAADGHFDVVLLDIGLPGMDGYEVARRIRGEDWGRDLKLVALTGWGQSEDRRRSREAGFDLHLVKPVPPDRLEQALAGLATAN